MKRPGDKTEWGVEVSAERPAGPSVRPRDAATIVLIDRTTGFPRVLVGKRSSRHVFMPDTYVFPGGRRDASDHALPFASDLHPLVLARLTGERGTEKSARAIALAALRELHEETGLTLGDAAGGRLRASLHTLRYVARAVTPPGNVRRFDTRFFSTFADEAGINPDLIRDTGELHDLRWLDLRDVDSLSMPRITRTVLEDLKKLMSMDPALPFGSPVPFYYSRRGQSFRSTV